MANIAQVSLSPPPAAATATPSGNRAGGLLALLTAAVVLVSPAVLSAQTTTPDAGGNQAAARLAIRVNQLEQELRSATGKVEELSFEVRRLEERLEKLSSDVDYRLNERSPGAAATGTGAASATLATPSGGPSSPVPTQSGGPRVLGPQPGSASVQPPAESRPVTQSPPEPTPAQQQVAAVQGSPREQYAQAFVLLQKANYAEAETAFGNFLKRYPDDPLSENARYWLGETYYVRGNYAKAAETFLEGYEKHKTGAKAPDTLLKLGMSLAGLNKTKEACASFRELTRAFPETSPAVKERAVQEQQRLKCP